MLGAIRPRAPRRDTFFRRSRLLCVLVSQLALVASASRAAEIVRPGAGAELRNPQIAVRVANFPPRPVHPLAASPNKNNGNYGNGSIPNLRLVPQATNPLLVWSRLKCPTLLDEPAVSSHPVGTDSGADSSSSWPRSSTFFVVSGFPVTARRAAAGAIEGASDERKAARNKDPELVLRWERGIRRDGLIWDRPLMAAIGRVFPSCPARTPSAGRAAGPSEPLAYCPSSSIAVSSVFADGSYELQIPHMLHGLLDHVPAPLTASPRDLDFPDVLDLYLKHARFFAPRTVVRSVVHRKQQEAGGVDTSTAGSAAEGAQALSEGAGVVASSAARERSPVLPNLPQLLGAGNVPTVRDFREEKDGGTFIGRGSFSVVHAAEWSGHRVAVKRFVFGTGAKAGGPGGGITWADYLGAGRSASLLRRVLDGARNECEWARRIASSGEPAARFFVQCLSTNIGDAEDEEVEGKMRPPLARVKAAPAPESSDELYSMLSYAGEPLTDEILAENEGEELAVRVLAQLTEAVDFLRNKMGASHHDLKRAHVLFDRTHREIRIIALGGMSSLAVGVLPDVVDSRSTAARSSPPKRGSSENHPLPHAHPLVVWTPTFAPEEFEEKAYSVIDGACEKASSYDIFSLANVFSELILGFNVIAKRYTTFCNAPHLANWQQHACLARRLPYFVEWARLREEMMDRSATGGGSRSRGSSPPDKAVDEAPDVLSTLWQQAIDAGSQSGARQLTQDGGEFAQIFQKMWRRMFLTHDERLQAFEELTAFLRPLFRSSGRDSALVEEEEPTAGTITGAGEAARGPATRGSLVQGQKTEPLLTRKGESHASRDHGPASPTAAGAAAANATALLSRSSAKTENESSIFSL